MNNPLDRITELIKRTGDTVVVLDSAGHPAYVILAFGKYEESISSPHSVPKRGGVWGGDGHSGKDVDNHFEPASAWEPPSTAFEPMIEQNSLNVAKNQQKDEAHEEKYYFEPIS